MKASYRFHSSVTRLVRPGEAKGLRGAVGEEGDAGDSNADSERVRWKRGSVERSISAADIRKLVSERLPFFSNRALKESLLVDDLRRFRWMELVCRGSGDTGPGATLVGVAGGDGGWLPARDLSSSESLRPRTLRLDLGEDVDNPVTDTPTASVQEKLPGETMEQQFCYEMRSSNVFKGRSAQDFMR